MMNGDVTLNRTMIGPNTTTVTKISPVMN